MPAADTIAAVSTPPGRGGIGIVRLSGPQAAEIAAQLVTLRQPLEPARARIADVRDPDDSTARIDEAVVTWFAAPHSYTAEDVVEIAAHGSPVVLDLLLRRALALGARLADPGEFTQRAFLAGRLDLTQAEAVRDLIDAQTLTQARQAASQMGGALSRRVLPVKQSLTDLIALLEAGIDFAEDDVDVTPPSEIARRIQELTPPLAALENSFARGRIVHDGLTLAIVGRPNAGKSSLFNCLVQRDRAIVTATPGTTRDLVTERIALDGIPLELVDTAGLRETSEEIEQLGIARSREALADAAIVLVVLDATQPLNDEERSLLASLHGRAALVAFNKCDLAAPSREDAVKDTDGCPILRAASSCEGWETTNLTRPNPSFSTNVGAPGLASETWESTSPAPPQPQSSFVPANDSRSSQQQVSVAGVGFNHADDVGRNDEILEQNPSNSAHAENVEGGFFLRKKPLKAGGPGYIYSDSAIAPEGIPSSLAAIPTSALTGEGIASLRTQIVSLATGGAQPEPGPLTSLRHQQAIATARAALNDAATANANNIPHEMILLDLYRALWALDSLTGQTTPDDILNLIFSTFCIGK